MSTCPDTDIHSLYIDDELPDPYKNRFEKHLRQCPLCKKKYDLLRFQSDALKQDAASIVFSDEELDEGFERLQTKLRFMEHVYKGKKERKSTSFFLKKLVPVIAASFLFALILPIRYFYQQVPFMPLETPTNALKTGLAPSGLNVSLVKEKGVVATNNFIMQKLVSQFSNDKEAYGKKMSYTVDLSSAELTSMDIFRPQLDSNEVRISITLSGVADMPVSLTPLSD